jgi:hypothetical protein
MLERQNMQFRFFFPHQDSIYNIFIQMIIELRIFMAIHNFYSPLRFSQAANNKK